MTGHTPQDAQQCTDDDGQGNAIMAEHITCAHCGYDLHGLRNDGHCPECGRSIALTLETLRHSRGWLVALSSGAQAMLVAHYVLLISMVLFPLLPLGLCFYILLMLGAAIELGSPGSSGRYSNPRDRIPGRRIGAGMLAAVVSLMLLGTPWIAFGIMVLGFLAMASGIVYLWLVYARILRRGLSLRAAALSSLLVWMHIAAATLSTLDLILILLKNNGAPIAALVGLVGVLTAIIWFATVITALVALHIGQSAVDRAVVASELSHEAGEESALQASPQTIRARRSTESRDP